MMWRGGEQGGGAPRGVARLVGESGPMRELKALIPRVAASPFPVVIEGESGTGKELIARAIHEEGPRRGAVFVPVNCAVLGDELFESELFGHAKGAFTGAVHDRKGMLELFSGGTVFLDEVAELTPRAQAKLLRVLQPPQRSASDEFHAVGVAARSAAVSVWWGRSRHYGRRNTAPLAGVAEREQVGNARRFGARGQPAGSDSGCDTDASSQSHAAAAQSGRERSRSSTNGEKRRSSSDIPTPKIIPASAWFRTKADHLVGGDDNVQ